MADETYSIELKAEATQLQQQLDAIQEKLRLIDKGSEQVGKDLKKNLNTNVEVKGLDVSPVRKFISVLESLGKTLFNVGKYALLFAGIGKGLQVVLRGLLKDSPGDNRFRTLNTAVAAIAGTTANLVNMIPGARNFVKTLTGIDLSKISGATVNFSVFVNSMSSLLKSQPQAAEFAQNYVTAFTNIEKSFKTFFTSTRQAGTWLGAAVATWWRNPAWKGVEQIGKTFVNVFQGVWKDVQRDFEFRFPTLSKHIENAFNNTKDFLKPWYDTTKRTVTSTVDFLSRGFKSVGTTIATSTKNAFFDFEQRFPKTAGTVRNFFDSIGTFATTATKKVAGFWSGFIDFFKSDKGKQLGKSAKEIGLGYATMAAGVAGMLPMFDRYGAAVGLADDVTLAAAKGMGQLGIASGGMTTIGETLVLSFNKVNLVIALMGAIIESVGKKILQISVNWGIAAGQTELAMSEMQNALESSTAAMGKNLGTSQEWTAFVKDLARQTGQADDAIARLTYRFLQLEPSMQLTQDQIKQIVTRTAVLGTAFGNLEDISFKVVSGFSGFVGPLNRFLGLGARTSQLQHLMAQGAQVAAEATQGQIDAQRNAAFSSELFNLFMRGTTAALGTVSENSDNVVLALNRLRATVHNTQEAFGSGNKALVVFSNALSSILNALQDIPEPIRVLISNVLGVIGVFTTALGAILKYAGAFILLTQSIRIFNAVVSIPLGKENTVGTVLSKFLSDATGTPVIVNSASTAVAAFGKVILNSFQMMHNAVFNLFNARIFAGTGESFVLGFEKTIIDGLKVSFKNIANFIASAALWAQMNSTIIDSSKNMGIAIERSLGRAVTGGYFARQYAAALDYVFNMTSKVAGLIGQTGAKISIIAESMRGSTIAARAMAGAYQVLTAATYAWSVALRVLEVIWTTSKIFFFYATIVAFAQAIGIFAKETGLASLSLSDFAAVGEIARAVFAKVQQFILLLAHAFVWFFSVVISGFNMILWVVGLFNKSAREVSQTIQTKLNNAISESWKGFKEAGAQLFSWSTQVGHSSVEIESFAHTLERVNGLTREQTQLFEKFQEAIRHAGGEQEDESLRLGKSAAAQKKIMDDLGKARREAAEQGKGFIPLVTKQLAIKIPGITEPIKADPAMWSKAAETLKSAIENKILPTLKFVDEHGIEVSYKPASLDEAKKVLETMQDNLIAVQKYIKLDRPEFPVKVTLSVEDAKKLREKLQNAIGTQTYETKKGGIKFRIDDQTAHDIAETLTEKLAKVDTTIPATIYIPTTNQTQSKLQAEIDKIPVQNLKVGLDKIAFDSIRQWKTSVEDATHSLDQQVRSQTNLNVAASAYNDTELEVAQLEAKISDDREKRYDEIVKMFRAMYDEERKSFVGMGTAIEGFFLNPTEAAFERIQELFKKTWGVPIPSNFKDLLSSLIPDLDKYAQGMRASDAATKAFARSESLTNIIKGIKDLNNEFWNTKVVANLSAKVYGDAFDVSAKRAEGAKAQLDGLIKEQAHFISEVVKQEIDAGERALAASTTPIEKGSAAYEAKLNEIRTKAENFGGKLTTFFTMPNVWGDTTKYINALEEEISGLNNKIQSIQNLQRKGGVTSEQAMHDIQKYTTDINELNAEIRVLKTNTEITKAARIVDLGSLDTAMGAVSNVDRELRLTKEDIEALGNTLGKSVDPYAKQIEVLQEGMKNLLAARDALAARKEVVDPKDVEVINAINAALEVYTNSLRRYNAEVKVLTSASTIRNTGLELENAIRTAVTSGQVFGDTYDTISNSIDAVSRALETYIDELSKLQTKIRLEGGIGSPEDQKNAQAYTNEIVTLKKKLEDLRVISDIRDMFQNAFDVIAQGVDDTINGVIEGTMKLVDGVKKVIHDMLMSLSEDIFKKFVVAPIKKAVEGFILSKFKVSIEDTTPQGQIKSAAQLFTTAVTDFNLAVQKFMTIGTTNPFTFPFSTNANVMGGTLNPGLNGGYSILGGIANGGYSIMGGAPNGGYNLGGNILDDFSKKAALSLDGFSTTMTDGYNSMYNTLTSDFHGFYADDVGGWSGLYNAIRTGFQNFGSGIMSILSSIFGSSTGGSTGGGFFGGMGGLFGGLFGSIYQSSFVQDILMGITGWYAEGGKIPGLGSGDNTLIAATPGEYVTKKDAVNYYGLDFFNALNQMKVSKSAAHALASLMERGPRHFAEGGLVTPELTTAATSKIMTSHNTSASDRPIQVTIIDRSPKLDPNAFRMKPSEVTQIFVDGIRKDRVIRKVIHEDIKNMGG